MTARYKGQIVRVIRIEAHRAYIVYQGMLKRVNKSDLIGRGADCRPVVGSRAVMHRGGAAVKTTTTRPPDRDLFGARPGEYMLPDHAYHTVCQSCGAPMAFVKTPNGKAMPLSLATAETRDGVTTALPHWIDCPQAKEWSTKR